MPGADPTERDALSQEALANAAQFRTTLWTVVLTAGDRSSPHSDAALARLCQTYWLPVYAFIRKRGHPPDSAQDLTQSFFVRFLERNDAGRVRRERGRFRSFLMTSVENFLRSEHTRATRQKRGGGELPLSLDTAAAEKEFLNEPAETVTPASAFDKQWAKTLLDNAMQRLAGEYRESGKTALFEQLQSHLWGDSDSIQYDELSHRLSMSVVHLRVTAHRIRLRYKEILREEIAQTVEGPGEIDSELRYLLQVVSA